MSKDDIETLRAGYEAFVEQIAQQSSDRLQGIRHVSPYFVAMIAVLMLSLRLRARARRLITVPMGT